jgi:hypothetical protein
MFKFLSKFFKFKEKYPSFKIIKTKEDLRKEKILNEFIDNL